jgi:hypothetical protein
MAGSIIQIPNQVTHGVVWLLKFGISLELGIWNFTTCGVNAENAEYR